MTRLAELQQREDEEALAASARWPPSPDLSTDIQHLTREMHISDVNRNTRAELESALPSGEEYSFRYITPASSGWPNQQTAGYIFHSTSVPVSTATLGLIHRQDPALAALLREEPASLMTQRTRRKVYSTIRLLRSGLIGHYYAR